MTQSQASFDSVIINVNIATFVPNEGQLLAEDYGVISNGAVAMRDGLIAFVGSMSELPEFDVHRTPVINGQGQWLLPGLIDCHTHLLFAGNRANEFEQRLNGVPYQTIAANGGGIIATVRATRQADEQQLFELGKDRLNAFLREGVTTVESKSGYGLTVADELKLLQVGRLLNEHHPLSVVNTFLGAHALPPEYQGNADGYINLVCEEMLPAVAKQQLADAVDVFCEGIGFNLEQTRQVFSKAAELGLPVKGHVEQLTLLGGSELVAEFNGLSCDHIEYLDEAGVRAMANSGTVAVLLPGAFYSLRETQLPPIDLLRAHQVPMAVSSDFNPGTSPFCSLLWMLNMACTLFRLTPQEALFGATHYAAKALGLADRGQIRVGLRADFGLWQIQSPAQLCYMQGVPALRSLWIDGMQVRIP